jgi:hypothetical protein
MKIDLINSNLIPVACSNVEDMRKLAKQMRLISLDDPDDKPYRASASEKEANENAVSIEKSIVESGHLRFILFPPDNRLVNVVYTLLELNNTKEWNLSLSHATVDGPNRVDDDLALMICEAFLSNSYQEIEPKAIWKNVRHFINSEEEVSKIFM